MSETKWTPGPWRVIEFAGKAYDVIGPRVTNSRLGNEIMLGSPGFTERDKANAQLAAAAPELYEALVSVLQFVARASSGSMVSDESLLTTPLLNHPAFRKAQLALAKARGESV